MARMKQGKRVVGTRKSGGKQLNFNSIIRAMDDQLKAVDGFRSVYEDASSSGETQPLNSIGLIDFVRRYMMLRVFQLMDSGCLEEQKIVAALPDLDDAADEFFAKVMEVIVPQTTSLEARLR